MERPSICAFQVLDRVEPLEGIAPIYHLDLLSIGWGYSGARQRRNCQGPVGNIPSFGTEERCMA